MTLFCLVALSCWQQRRGLAPEQHPGVPGTSQAPLKVVGSVLVREMEEAPVGLEEQTEQHVPITGPGPHLHPGTSTWPRHCGLPGEAHFSPGSPLTSFSPYAQLSRDLGMTTSSFTTNVYKGLIYTLQKCKYLYLQNNLKTLIPLVRIKLGGQELDHGLKLNIPAERGTIKKVHLLCHLADGIIVHSVNTVNSFGGLVKGYSPKGPSFMVTQGSLLRRGFLETGSPGPTPSSLLGAFIRHLLLHYTWQGTLSSKMREGV